MRATAAHARWVSGAIGAGLFALTLAAFVRPPLLPAIGRDLGMTAFGLGMLGSVFAVGRLAADFPAGRMSDRVRPGPMMALSAALVTAGSLALAIAPGPLVAQAAIFVLGAGSTFTLTTAMAHFARAPRVKRGMALSAFAAWLLAGQSFGPAVGGSLGDRAGWRWAVGAAGALAALVSVAFLFFRAPIRPEARTEKRSPAGPARKTRPYVFWVIYLLPAVQFALGGALLQTLVPIVADAELGMGPGAVGAALGLGGVSRLVAALAAGQITDRVSRKWAVVPGQFLQTAGVALFMLSPAPWAWLASIVLVTLGSAGVNVGATILADLSEGGALGTRLAAFRFTGDSAFVVAPLLCGWLYQNAGRAAATLPLLVLSGLVSLSVWVLVPETRH